MIQRRTRGASLVEVLVVIIILVIGIFSIVRIFPYGFISLQRTGERAMAQQLARQMLERLKGSTENLPIAICPVHYVFNNQLNQYVLEVDPTVHPDDLGYDPTFGTDPNFPPDSYKYISDINRSRRIFGESCRVPAPRPVLYDKNSNLISGGLYQLLFAPIVTGDPAFVVYGPDLLPRYITSDPNNGALAFPGRLMRAGQEYYIDADRGYIWFPAPDPNSPAVYEWRVEVSVWAKGTKGLEYQDLIVPNQLTNGLTSGNGASWGQLSDGSWGIVGFSVAGYVANGATFVAVDWGSVRVSRQFVPVNGGQFTVGDPYQYTLVDPNLGLVLFNPAGYNYREQRQRQMIPLRANFDYDVLDWHIITDERRVSDDHPFNVKLTLNRIRRTGEMGEDQMKFTGMGIPSNPAADMVIIDTADGSVVSNDGSFTFDQLNGMVHFADKVNYTPLGSSQAESRSPAGRTYRILYMGMDYWGVQVQKAPQTFHQVANMSALLGWQQVYVDPGQPIIWFPRCTIGKSVLLRRYYWVDSGRASHLAENEDFVVLDSGPNSTYPGLGYITIKDQDHHPDGVKFDFTRTAYPVEGVLGTSVKVRAVWAPSLRERSDAERKASYPSIRYLPEWRKIDFDTHLVKEVAQ